jgi:Cysteine-rich CPCC
MSVTLANFPCPCCGYLVFDEPPGTYDICAMCGWEDDISQLRFPTTSGANAPLVECQQIFAADPRTRAMSDPGIDPRDSRWRPIDLTRDDFEVPVDGVDYGMTYPEDPTALYYWPDDSERSHQH